LLKEVISMVAMTIPTTIETPNWERLAACADLPGATQLFFSDELHEIARAKNICATCPVMVECLETALERREQWGIWGGQLFVAGKIVMNKRRRGRPSKHPRPEDQLPQIPVPEHLQHLPQLQTA